jgi:hypothetical protein
MGPSGHPARGIRLVTVHLTVLLLAPIVSVSAAEATRSAAPPSPAGVDTERGVVVIQCKAEQPRFFIRSRGAILDPNLDTAAGEIILTTGHGIPETAEAIRRNCTIQGERRRSYAIGHAWRGSVAGAREHDWAVLLTTRRLDEGARRLRYVIFESGAWSSLTERQAPAQLLLRRAEAERQTCRLARTWLTSAQIAAGLFTHSCRSWEGHSGSPIVIGINAEPVVVGIQLARIQRPMGGDGPSNLGLGRRLDEAIEDAVKDAVRLLNDGR